MRAQVRYEGARQLPSRPVRRGMRRCSVASLAGVDLVHQAAFSSAQLVGSAMAVLFTML